MPSPTVKPGVKDLDRSFLIGPEQSLNRGNTNQWNINGVDEKGAAGVRLIPNPLKD
jgi:hypothetical protein